MRTAHSNDELAHYGVKGMKWGKHLKAQYDEAQRNRDDYIRKSIKEQNSAKAHAKYADDYQRAAEAYSKEAKSYQDRANALYEQVNRKNVDDVLPKMVEAEARAEDARDQANRNKASAQQLRGVSREHMSASSRAKQSAGAYANRMQGLEQQQHAENAKRASKTYKRRKVARQAGQLFGKPVNMIGSGLSRIKRKK